jgi:transcription-repair coupling factor (superfamily II helicase)
VQSDIFEFLKDSAVKLIVTKDFKEAREVGEIAKFLEFDTFLLPDFRAVKGDDLRAFKDELFELFDSLDRYYKSKSDKKILISPYRAVYHPLPKEELLRGEEISFGDRIDLNSFKDRLYRYGYTFVDIVEETGEVSFRGDIIDIYPRGALHPFRVSLFDDEIESIKEFDPSKQKSFKDELESFYLPPAYFNLSKERYDELSSDVEMLKSDSFIKDIASLGLWALRGDGVDLLELKAVKTQSLDRELEESAEFLDKKRVGEFLELPTIKKSRDYQDISVLNVREFINFHKDKKITIIAKSEAQLKQHDIEDLDFKLIKSSLVVNLLSKEELILSLNRFEVKKRRKRPNILIDELKVGDYIVHESYGIGIFKGLKNVEVLGSKRDFIELSYQNDDKVLIPVENIGVIDRYIGEGGSLAIVDRLGRGSFAKLKEKTKKRLFEIAREIIETAAKRELKEAPIIRSDFEELELFRADAGFVYTDDQVKTVKEIFDDLKSKKVMDRLLSGDVGFGKTEVAMNAIFVTIKSGYKTALIAPTTLLVSQHYKTIKNRFEKYGFKIEKLDRFTSAKDKRRILEELKNGDIDLCIGTHALLGVEIKDLALLVIDEEHKFGVKQKERLKALRENLHILSMSATPIPRSLNMALSSIKSYSTLLTPPSEREDVRTFVKEYDENVVKEAILRELRRGGQIFYIHNKIASIESKKSELEKLIDGIKILVLHSKVPPATTEKEMLKFENGEYDILLSTSIVESGLDMPRVNTILVEEADRFGIADLHQLRGRVGRRDKRGYCYLLVKDKNGLNDDAIKRLLALESNSFLGAGTVLAYHDLEIRGGGNLIGEAQSGHIKGIGYALYLKMLEDSIKTLMYGEAKRDEKDVEIKLAVSAYISDELVDEDRVRLELYRRLGKCESVKEVYEIEEEMEDRFGRLDNPTKNFLDIVVIKILSKQKGIVRVMSYAQKITFVYSDEKKESIDAKSKDDDDILDATLGYLRK